jgi:hypothetical protein
MKAINRYGHSPEYNAIKYQLQKVRDNAKKFESALPEVGSKEYVMLLDMLFTDKVQAENTIAFNAC